LELGLVLGLGLELRLGLEPRFMVKNSTSYYHVISGALARRDARRSLAEASGSGSIQRVWV